MMQIEWQDHARRSLLLTGMSKTLWAMCCRNVATCKAVISQHWLVAGSQYSAAGLLLSVLRWCACHMIFRLACVGHIQ